MLGGRDPVGVDRLDVVGVGLAAPADQEALGDRARPCRPRAAGPAAGRRRAPTGRRSSAPSRRRGRGCRAPPRRRCRSATGSPTPARASPAPTARRRAGRRSGSPAGAARRAAGRARACRRPAAPTPARRGPCRRAPRCRRRGSGARRPRDRARRSRWRRRRRLRDRTGRRRSCAGKVRRSGRNVEILTPRPRALGWRPRMSDLMAMSVGELAAHVRGGELRAREVVTAALERIEERDGEINAFLEVDADGALATADTIEPGDERPFAGVPIAIKANTPVEGLRMNFGSKFLGGHRPDHSAYLVRRLQDAGFVIVGITNMPEFGILPTTEPRDGGPTRNPWDTSTHARRLVRRRGGGGRRRDAAGRARQRRRRLAAHPGLLLRPRRASSPAAAGCRAAPTSATPSSPATACSRARWARRRRCSTCSPATRSATRPGRRAPPSPTRPPCAATRAGCASR